jgi:hypothetical protein
MRQRCYNSRNLKFAQYGARGIRVCERWLHSFENFLADVGLKPSPELSLDRINNDGNYEPDNVRWHSAKQQANNRRMPRRKPQTVQTRQLSISCGEYLAKQREGVAA